MAIDFLPHSNAWLSTLTSGNVLVTSGAAAVFDDKAWLLWACIGFNVARPVLGSKRVAAMVCNEVYDR